MACRYFLDGKEYDATGLRAALKALPPERMAKYVPRAAQALASRTSTPDRFLKQVFRDIPDVTDAQATALLKIMQERPQDLGDALVAAMKPSTFDKFLEGWKAGLVSGIPTQFANVIGNVGEQVARLGETVTAAALDPLLGGPKTRLSGEARYELAGALKGASKSLARLGGDLRDIVKLAPEKLDISNLDRLPKIGGKTGRVIRTPFRFLSAFDDFFKGVGGEAELHKLAFRRAGGDITAAERLIADPPKELLEQVSKSRLERTFQDPNRMANAIITMRSNQKWLHIVAPFVQTPSNIARVAWERSPGGFYEGYKALEAYRQAARVGAAPDTIAKLKGEAVDKLARPLFGTAVLASFYAVAKAGGMTGSGPTDSKDRNALRSAGWQPYSFVIPVEDGKRLYVPFNRFEPISSILGLAADASEITDQKKAGDMFDKALGSIVQNFTSKTYLQGIADAASAISDPKQFMSQYVSNLSGSLVPTIVAKGAQAIDPIIRDTKPSSSGLVGIPERIAKTIMSRIPGASLALPAVKGGTGEDAERPGGAFARFLSPVLVSKDKPDSDVKRFLVEIDAAPTTPGRDLSIPNTHGRKVRLDDDEYAVLTEARHQATEKLADVVRNPSFLRMDIESQRAYVRRIYDRYETNARKRLAASPGFRAKAVEARRA